jgi:hypothetical protein
MQFMVIDGGGNHRPLSTELPGRTTGTTRSSVFSVRLNNDEIEALQRVAATAGLPASTLVRTWIHEGISAEVGTDLRSIVRQEVRTAVSEALAS